MTKRALVDAAAAMLHFAAGDSLSERHDMFSEGSLWTSDAVHCQAIPAFVGVAVLGCVLGC